MNRIKELRKRLGLSQDSLADILHVHQTAISQWERGLTSPDIDNLQHMSELFSVSVDYLLGRTDFIAADPVETKENQPAAKGDELDDNLINLLVDLSPSEVQRVLDFVSGIKASRKE